MDAIHKSTIKKVIHDIGEHLSITCLLVSHDPLDTLPWADNIIVMKDGEIVQQNTPYNIYHQPVNKYCAGLFGNYTLIEEHGKKFFFRPEHFVLSASKKDDQSPAIVQSISFCGAYFLVTLLCEGTLYYVTYDKNDLVPGLKVFIDMHPNHRKAWVLP
ncbi:MAG: hypothetical protein HYR66_02025 [Sphingobacteriales bacterium]|nr:hypothetical protein [Sphingobacteriales bacterium]